MRIDEEHDNIKKRTTGGIQHSWDVVDVSPLVERPLVVDVSPVVRAGMREFRPLVERP